MREPRWSRPSRGDRNVLVRDRHPGAGRRARPGRSARRPPAPAPGSARGARRGRRSGRGCAVDALQECRASAPRWKPGGLQRRSWTSPASVLVCIRPARSLGAIRPPPSTRSPGAPDTGRSSWRARCQLELPARGFASTTSSRRRWAHVQRMGHGLRCRPCPPRRLASTKSSEARTASAVCGDHPAMVDARRRERSGDGVLTVIAAVRDMGRAPADSRVIPVNYAHTCINAPSPPVAEARLFI